MLLRQTLLDCGGESIDRVVGWARGSLGQVEVELRAQPKANASRPLVRVAAAGLHHDRHDLVYALAADGVVKLALAILRTMCKGQSWHWQQKLQCGGGVRAGAPG